MISKKTPRDWPLAVSHIAPVPDLTLHAPDHRGRLRAQMGKLCDRPSVLGDDNPILVNAVKRPGALRLESRGREGLHGGYRPMGQNLCPLGECPQPGRPPGGRRSTRFRIPPFADEEMKPAPSEPVADGNILLGRAANGASRGGRRARRDEWEDTAVGGRDVKRKLLRRGGPGATSGPAGWRRATRGTSGPTPPLADAPRAMRRGPQREVGRNIPRGIRGLLV